MKITYLQPYGNIGYEVTIIRPKRFRKFDRAKPLKFGMGIKVRKSVLNSDSVVNGTNCTKWY